MQNLFPPTPPEGASGVYMEQIWHTGLKIIMYVQRIRSPFFDAFFSFISFFGTHYFFLFLLTFMYWCNNKKYASRIVVLFLISGWSNTVLKDIINHPRPYNLNPAVKIGGTSGPGLPSGHAQQSLVVFSALALWRRNPVFTCFAAVSVFMIALSRIYLGVHFPTDILGGWLIGAVILMLLWPAFDKINKFMKKADVLLQAVVFLSVPPVLSLAAVSKWSVMSMGVFSGFCSGLILEKKYIRFSRPGKIYFIFARYLTGAVLPVVLLSAEKMFLVKDGSYYFITVYLFSLLLGLWVSAGAPWLFKKIGI